MAGVVRPPCDQLLRVADLLESAVGVFIDARSRVAPDGTWEAPIEAWALSNLLLRNVEAVSLLARTDEVLVVAAWANTRNAIDLSARILWLIQPSERFEAEARWLTLVRDYVQYFERLSEFAGGNSALRLRMTAAADQVREFADGVADRFPAEHVIPTRVPAVRDILGSLGAPDLYGIYVEGSQYMHGTMRASSVFRSGLGRDKLLGETTSAKDWVLPLRISWNSLRSVAHLVLLRLGQQPGRIDWRDLPALMEEALANLANATSRD